MKAGIRVIGIDDAPFLRNERRSFLVAAVMRYGRLEDVLACPVDVDGSDSTRRIISMLESKYGGQGKAIFLHSITVAGLNIVDIDKLADRLRCPVVCITDRKVHGEEMKNVLDAKFPGRAKLLRKTYRCGRYYISYAGITNAGARSLVKQFGYEPVRTAHVIARGMKNGKNCG